MNQKTTWQKIKLPVIIVGALIIIGLGTWLIVMAMGGSVGNRTAYGTEGSIDGKTIAVSDVERLPMTNPTCDDVIMLFATKENYDCIIANVTITNDTDQPYEFDPLFLETLSPTLENAEYQPLPSYRDDEAMTASTTIEPGSSYTYKLYVSIEKGEELDLSFAPDEQKRTDHDDILLDLN